MRCEKASIKLKDTDALNIANGLAVVNGGAND